MEKKDGGAQETRLQREFAGRDREAAVRVNKYLSEAGVCSRREADRLIEAGRVLVDGRAAGTGDKVLPGQCVTVDGKDVRQAETLRILALNKPRGVVCTTDRRWGDPVVEDLIDIPERVFCVGRLDKDSEGLLLLTNDGEILNKIMRAGNYHEKEYEVTVDRAVTGEFLAALAAGGIPVQGQRTRPCRVTRTGARSFRIILTQGLNRQIRRMCEYLGYRVTALLRIRVMNIRLGSLQSGKFRELTAGEQEQLFELLKGSYSAPRPQGGRKR